MGQQVFFLLIRFPSPHLFYTHVHLYGGYGGTIAWHMCSANFDYPARTNHDYP